MRKGFSSGSGRELHRRPKFTEANCRVEIVDRAWCAVREVVCVTFRWQHRAIKFPAKGLCPLKSPEVKSGEL
jgi:hypothetical protein